MGAADLHFLGMLEEAEKNLDALRLLWPALRRHRLGYTVLSQSGSPGLDPEAPDHATPDDDRRDLQALLGVLQAFNVLAQARRGLESRAEALAARLRGEDDVCPVCRRTVDYLKDSLCLRCYQSFYGWRNKPGNIGNSPEEWVTWRRDNLKSRARTL